MIKTMPEDKKDDKRKRMVVEEVGEVKPEVTPSEPLEEIKEKAQEIEELADVAAAPPEVKPVYQEQYVPQGSSSKGLNPFLIIIPGIFLLGGLLGGIIFYQNRVSGTAPAATDSPTIAPGELATPTSTPVATEIDLTKYNINILNGSGTAGEAGKVEALLEKGGFKVSGTGNAATYDFTKTVIQAKSDVDKNFLAKLSETLGEVYLVDTKTQNLAASSKDEVIVIVGSSKK